MATIKDLYLDQGSDFLVQILVEVLTDPSQEYNCDTNPIIPKDLSLYTGKFTIKADYSDSAPILELDSLLLGGVELNAQGVFSAAIPGRQSDLLVLPEEVNEYYYDAEIIQLDYSKRISQGKFIISKNLK